MAFTRRHLPHWIPENAAVFVTWRLAGSFSGDEWAGPSRSRAGQAPREHAALTDDRNRSSVLPRLLEQDEQLDRVRNGPAWLRDSRVALCDRECSVRLDQDIVDRFLEMAEQSGGATGYQTLINAALREYLEGKAPRLEDTLRRIIREELKSSANISFASGLHCG